MHHDLQNFFEKYPSREHYKVDCIHWKWVARFLVQKSLTMLLRALKVSNEVLKIDFTFVAPETFLSQEVRMTGKHHRLDTPFEKTSKRLVISPKGWLSSAIKARKDSWQVDSCHHPPILHTLTNATLSKVSDSGFVMRIF